MYEIKHIGLQRKLIILKQSFIPGPFGDHGPGTQIKNPTYLKLRRRVNKSDKGNKPKEFSVHYHYCFTGQCGDEVLSSDLISKVA